ncbi:MAG: hypothetical protein ACM31C_08260 [Acidobacteriota bacterium]
MCRLAFSGLVLAACSQPTATTRQELSAAQKQERYTLIRDSAYQMGHHNAALLAGIAISETGLAHCYSEAPSFSCPGPNSPSCGDTAVIAGGADGPCSAQQGGLGMFQFDAGTYTDTLNTYGPQILTVEGNTAQAVWFVEDKVERDITGGTGWLDAMAWMNMVPLDAADPVMNRWAQLVACRYNGCCDTTSATCQARANGYRDNAITAYSDMGAAFWDVAGRCHALPADGVIDERSDCYLAGGDPRYWRHETSGYGGALDWTMTTAAASYANFAMWIVKTGGPGRYHVDVYLDGGAIGQSKQAQYEIAHAGATDVVMVDQTSASGFVSLGEFDFAGTGDEHVLLGDNTGEAAATSAQLLFDAVRVQPIDGGASDTGCGCRTGGGSAAAGGALLLLVLLRKKKQQK